MMEFKCTSCSKTFYVNPSVLKQKKTRCPYCNRLQEVEEYPRTGFHDGIFRTREERQRESEARQYFMKIANQALNEVDNEVNS